MNLQYFRPWMTVRWLLRDRHATLEQSANAEEVQQLDLLLSELTANEQHLTPSYWSNQAQAFADNMALQESTAKGRPTRFGQLKPLLTTGLPIGGLVALGFVLSQPRAPVGVVAPQETAALAPNATGIADLPTEVHVIPEIAEINEAPSVRAPEDPQLDAPEVATRPDAPVARSRLKRRASRSSNDPRSSDSVVADRPAALPNVELAGSVPPHVPAETVAAAANDVPEPDTFSEQLQALKAADRALKSGDNASAKAALARKFSPQLTLHANSLRAVLACQTRDVAAGKRYLDSQTKSHPNSPYLDRMRRACGVTFASNPSTNRQQ